MSQFDVALYRAIDNIAHLPACRFDLPACGHAQAGKVRRHTRFFVTAELDSGIERFVPDEVYTARKDNNQIRLRRIFAFLPPASWEVTSRGLL